MSIKTSKTILRLTEVKRRTGVSKGFIYKHMKTGCFPQSIKIGANAVGWLESDINAYITELESASRMAA